MMVVMVMVMVMIPLEEEDYTKDDERERCGSVVEIKRKRFSFC
jgi:hypothetical protein